MEYRENQNWMNWSQGIQITPERMYYPKTVEDLTELVRTAQRDRKRVRAIGSGWSFTDVMATEDYLVDTTGLSGVLGFSQGTQSWGPTVYSWLDLPEQSSVLPEALTDTVRRSDRRLVHVLAGTKIEDVYQTLDRTAYDRPSSVRDRWALKTMGGASGQSLAGAISTGTHGGDFDERPIADMVQAIHLVGPDGSQHWIEREGSGAITDRERLAEALPDVSDDHIHYDDDWFNSVLVSVGTMGIVYAYVIEAREQFGLSEHRLETTWSDLKPMLASGEIFDSTQYSASNSDRRWIDHHPDAPGRTPKGIGIFINPYRTSDDYAEGADADRKAVLITHAESSHFDGAHTPTGGASVFDLFHIISDFKSAGNLRDTRRVVDRVIESLRQDGGTDGKYRVGYSVLDTTSGGRPPILSLEFAVTTADGKHVEFVDRLFEIFDGIMRDQWFNRGVQAKFGGGISLRFTRPTKAYLGMSHSSDPYEGERFCHIEVIVARLQWEFGRPPLGAEGHDYTENNMANITEVFIDHFERATDEFDVRLHWGQFSRTNRFDPDRYGEFYTWLRVRDDLTNGRSIWTFENDFSTRHLNPQYDVALHGPNGKVVVAEGGGGRELVANRDHIDTWETFKLIRLGGDRVALRTYHGQYVSANRNRSPSIVADATDIGVAETFSQIPLGDGKVGLMPRGTAGFVGLDDNGRLVAGKRSLDGAAFEIEDLRTTVGSIDPEELEYIDLAIDPGMFDWRWNM